MRPPVVREATKRARPGGLQERAQQVGGEVGRGAAARPSGTGAGQGAAPRRAAPPDCLPYGNETEFILFVRQEQRACPAQAAHRWPALQREQLAYDGHGARVGIMLKASFSSCQMDNTSRPLS